MTSLINEFPIEVFRLIHEWSSDKEYRSFMNAGFRDIKYETVFLNLTFQFQMIERIQEQINNFCLKVRDSRKQIGLKFISCPSDLIVELSRDFQRVYSVCVEQSCVEFDEDLNGEYFFLEPALDFSTFDFSIFNNVPRVSLTGFQTVRRIRLENIRDLELISCTLLEELNLTRSQCLDKLRLEACPSLKVISPLPHVSSFFTDVRALEDNFPIVSSRFRSFTYIRHFDGVDCQRWDETSLRNLQTLHLNGEFLSLPPVQILSNIADLSLFNYGTSCPLPVLSSASRLRLSGFDLTQWSGAVLENVRELELAYCKNLRTLMTMPRVRKVLLRNLPSLSLEKELPACVCFELEGIEAVRTLPRLPRLSRLDLRDCDNLVDLALPSDHVLDFASIASCVSLSAIECLKNCHVLSIFGCEAITSFHGFDEGILVPNRSICLNNLWNLRDISGLSCLGSLTISGATELTVSNVRDIDHLEIDRCRKLTIKNIGNGVPISAREKEKEKE
jgi:hypothetical protein